MIRLPPAVRVLEAALTAHLGSAPSRCHGMGTGMLGMARASRRGTRTQRGAMERSHVTVMAAAHRSGSRSVRGDCRPGRRP